MAKTTHRVCDVARCENVAEYGDDDGPAVCLRHVMAFYGLPRPPRCGNAGCGSGARLDEDGECPLCGWVPL